MSASFGNWLRQQRSALGLTQQELGQKIGCSAALIRKIEAGERRPSSQMTDLLTLHLGIAETDRDGFIRFARAPQREEIPWSAPHSSTLSPLLSPLTQREGDILKLIANDVADDAIAEHLSLKITTVRWYVKQIYSKLGVHGRDEAIAYAGELPPIAFAQPRLAPTTPNNLPASSTSFVGRQPEIAEVCKLLLQSQVRLLTLHGPPGIGKTRFSLETATTLLNDFPDGVYFVPLAALTDPLLVPNAIVQRLGIQEVAGQPIIETLTHYLHDKHLLLVLDNFEHLLAATPLVANLLSAVSTLKVLATSREILNIYGEQTYPLPALSLPDSNSSDVEKMGEYEAVKLFVQRAQAAKPDFELTAANASIIADICMRLDGLPLAIELAATRTKLYPPDMLIKRLESRMNMLTGGARDLPERHQTLRRAIAWSYDLLSEDKKRLFTRLSIFAGGWTLEAMEVVCSTGLSMDVFDGLESLLNKSLVQQIANSYDEPRFLLLETIREYALEQLTASGEAEDLCQHHADYFTLLAERTTAEVFHADPVRFLSVLDAELDNFRVALASSQTSLHLALALHEFWLRRGYLPEGSRWLNHGLTQFEAAIASRTPTPVDRLLRAKALEHLGTFTAWQGDRNSALTPYEESLALYRELDNIQGIASVLGRLGNLFQTRGEHAQASPLLNESLALFRELGDTGGIAWALTLLGWLSYTSGDRQRAGTLWQESLVLFRAMNELWGIASSLSILATFALDEGDYEQVNNYLTESLIRFRALGERWQILYTLDMFACLAAAQGLQTENPFPNGIRSVRISGAVEALRETFGAPIMRFRGYTCEQIDSDLRLQIDEATFDLAWAEGRKMTLDQVIAYVLEPVHF